MLTNVDDTMEYKREGTDTWIAVDLYNDTVEGLAAGNYLVRIKATGKDFCSESVKVTIGGSEFIAEEAPYVEIFYQAECFSCLEPGAYYIINGTEMQADDNGEIAIDSKWMKGKDVSIIKKGNNYSTGNSLPKKIKVKKRPAAPKGITAVNESGKDKNDGKLIGVNANMEYCVKGNEDWSPAGDDMIEFLDPAKYDIRYMSTDEDFASSAVTKTIYPYGYKPKEANTADANQLEGDNLEETSGGSNEGLASGSSQKNGDADNKSGQDAESAGAGTSDILSSQNTDIEAGKDISKDDLAALENTQTDNKDVMAGEDIICIPVKLENKRLIPLTKEDIWNEAYEKGYRTVYLLLEDGKVAVTVNNVDEALCEGKVSDVVEAANALLTIQDMVYVKNGGFIEIRSDIECIDNSVSQSDKDIIEEGIKAYSNESLNTGVGMYMDISVFMRVGEGEWEAVHETNEPIELTFYIPDNVKELSGGFYTMRVHKDTYQLLSDIDDDADTLTIQTDLFSTYALLYELEAANLYTNDAADGNNEYSLVRIFLEKGGLAWAAIILAELIIIVMIIIYAKSKRKQNKGCQTEL